MYITTTKIHDYIDIHNQSEFRLCAELTPFHEPLKGWGLDFWTQPNTINNKSATHESMGIPGS